MLNNEVFNELDLQEAADVVIAAFMASKWHSRQGQKDRAGVPYFHHILRVGVAMSPDPLGMKIGFLHDICEDTEVTVPELLGTYGPEVAAGVGILTRDTDNETYWQYIDRVIQHSSYCPTALLVKRADLLDNLLPWRQNFVGAKSLLRRHIIALYQVENALITRGLLNESERYPAVGGTVRTEVANPVEGRRDPVLDGQRIANEASSLDYSTFLDPAVISEILDSYRDKS